MQHDTRNTQLSTRGWVRGLTVATLSHEVWINASTTNVYESISTADGVSRWWDKQTAVQTDQGTVLEHNPGPEHGVVRIRILKLVQNMRVEWVCVSEHPTTSPASAWTGTHITFEISSQAVPPWAAHKSQMTVLHFRHSGWDEASPFLGFCNFAWAEALRKLKQVCESR